METTENKQLFEQEFKCLDKGFVRLIDVMGNDESIVQAARVSYGKGTKTLREDRGLIRYLMRNKHTSPIEMVEFKFHCKMPIFVARQWVRHRTASLNEYSGRYSIMKDEYYVPEKFTGQNPANKQGRNDEDLSYSTSIYFDKDSKPVARSIKFAYEENCKESFAIYNEMIKAGVSKELARMHLPLSTYTEWYWKIDLHNLLHFLRLRLDTHAQYEIRVFAEAIAEIVKQVVPLTWEAFEDYVLYAHTFSKQEMEILRTLLVPTVFEGLEKHILEYDADIYNTMSKREQEDFLSLFNTNTKGEML